MSSTARDEEASTLIERCGYAAAALTLIPVPLAGEVGVAAVHAGMVVGLARLHGVTLTSEHAAAMVLRIGATIGASWLGTRVALGLAKVVLPLLPGLVGAPLVFCSTLGLGAVVGASFSSGEAKELTDDEVRAIYKDALSGARKRFDPRKVAEPAARAAAEAAVAAAAAPAPPPLTTPPPVRSPYDPAVTRAPGPSPFDSAVTPPPQARPPIEDALAAVKTDRLTRLRRLRDEGVLLDSEYDAACRQLAEEA